MCLVDPDASAQAGGQSKLVTPCLDDGVGTFRSREPLRRLVGSGGLLALSWQSMDALTVGLERRLLAQRVLSFDRRGGE